MKVPQHRGSVDVPARRRDSPKKQAAGGLALSRVPPCPHLANDRGAQWRIPILMTGTLDAVLKTPLREGHLSTRVLRLGREAQSPRLTGGEKKPSTYPASKTATTSSLAAHVGLDAGSSCSSWQ